MLRYVQGSEKELTQGLTHAVLTDKKLNYNFDLYIDLKYERNPYIDFKDIDLIQILI